MPEKISSGEDNTGRKTNEEDEVKRRNGCEDKKRIYMFRRHVGRVSDLELLLS